MDTHARPGGDQRAGATLAPERWYSGRDGPRSTAELVRGIAEDASRLVRQEFLLARQELTEGATVAAKAGAVLAAAGVVGLFALGFLLTTLAWGLVDAGLPRWAGFGIVALLLLIVAAILGLVGKRRLAAAKLSPSLAQAELKQATSDLVEGARTGVDHVRVEATASAESAKVGAVALQDRAAGRAREAVEDTAGGARDFRETASGMVRRLRGRLERRRGGSAPPSP
jgi:Putative Actinobacterial Holin-X, holin superfamily III